MTLNEVKKAEKTIIPFSENSNELVYNIELNDEINCKLIYEFSNGILIKVLYIVYGPNDDYSRGTCEKNIPVSYKLDKIKFIFDALIEKKMAPILGGWDISGIQFAKVDDRLQKGTTDRETFKLIQEELNRLNGTGVDIAFENTRSFASFTIRNFTKQNFVSSYKCNDNYYNTYLWLNITPSYEVKKELKKRDF
ncbi:hypothetical protein [Flavobacterium sp.]|uniref:hypothetical protein n=1 Tax=Flavobacterium sp. TaxID=239 RepID=UPI0037534AE4